MRNDKVFISGKITGEPLMPCIAKFVDAKLDLMIGRRILNVVNPLNLEGIYFGIGHEEALKICLAELKTCAAIFMLKDWKESKGAQIEHDFALKNNIKIIYQ